MSSTISDGTTTITPAEVDGYDSARPSRNLVHDIIGTTEPAVTLRGAGLRTGTLSCVMGTDRALATQLEAMLSAPGVFTFATSDVADLGMSFIVAGDLHVQLDDDTRSVWIVAVPFQEVAT